MYLTSQPFHGGWVFENFTIIITLHGGTLQLTKHVVFRWWCTTRRPRQYVLICRNYNAAFIIYEAKTHRDGRRIAATRISRERRLCTQRRYHTTKHKLILNNKMQIECFIPRLVSSGPCRVPWSLVHLPLPAACTHRATRNTEPRGNENRVKGKNPVVIKKWPKISAEGRKSPACSFYAANLDYVVRSRNGAI